MPDGRSLRHEISAPQRVLHPVFGKAHLGRIDHGMGMEQVSQTIGKIPVAIDGTGHDANHCGARIEARRVRKMRGEVRVGLGVEWKRPVPYAPVVRAGIAQIVQAVEPGLEHRRRQSEDTCNRALPMCKLLVQRRPFAERQALGHCPGRRQPGTGVFAVVVGNELLFL